MAHTVENLSHVTSDPKSGECKLSGMAAFTRTLDLMNPERLEPYHRRATEFKPQLHWGQLKLFLTEVEFLTQVRRLTQKLYGAPKTFFKIKLDQKLGGNSKNQVDEFDGKEEIVPLKTLGRNTNLKVVDQTPKIILIYPGAAPGNHTNFLHSMFPEMDFYLYDKQKFAIRPSKQIHIYEQYFFDNDAQKWKVIIDKMRQAGENVVVALCSDIRTEPATEEEVAKNMEMQRTWWEIIEPDLTMFKFRLPWKPGTTVYPKGEIYIQPFAGQTSTETRLIFGKRQPLIEYNNQKYEQAMFFHNTKARNCLWKSQFNVPPILIVDGFCTCYDCTALVWILADYLEFDHQKSFSLDQEKTLKNLIKTLEKYIGSARSQTILSQTRESHKKIQKFVKQYTENPELLDVPSDQALKKRTSKSRLRQQKQSE